MYKVYCDNYLLYSDQINNLKIINPKLNVELNKIDYFDFTIYPDHPYYNMINKLKSLIVVYRNNDILFRGRVYSVEKGFYNQKFIECESDLGFLNDSILRPFEFEGDIDDFLEQIITNHNTQVQTDHQFVLGNITVTDNNSYLARSSINPLKSLDVIQDKLIKMYGGYLCVRHENNVNYLDYLEDFSSLSPQTIELNKNLLDLKSTVDSEGFATFLLPYGAKQVDEEGKETDTRLDITSVNNNVDYVYNAAAAAQYGTIWTTHTWDDVTLPENLLTKAQNYLNELITLATTFEVTAADLATINNNILPYKIGTYVNVKSPVHGLQQQFLITKLNINLLEPASNKITLGAVIKNFTDRTKDLNKVESNLVNRIETTESNARDVIYSLDNRLTTSIQQTADNIMLSTSEAYYTKEETNNLVSETATELNIYKDEVELKFTQYNANLEDLEANTDVRFTNIDKYIRFIDGAIELGNNENPLTLTIENDKIAFRRNGEIISYWDMNDENFLIGNIYVETNKEARFGNFAFKPRENGSLSFVKVGD